MMHTCDPPGETIDRWLKAYVSVKDRYGHILLEQAQPGDDVVRKGLTPYFESAHSDAREYFHKFAGMSLHPDEGQAGCNAIYPNCLPPKTRSGLFGEVLSGMITEAFEFVGEHEWVIPVFLFRKQEDVAQYIYTLSRDPSRKREVLGRKGDDFIGLVIDDGGNVKRFIAGEAKWRKTWFPSTRDEVMLGDKTDPDPNDPEKKIHNGKGVWFEINRALPVPIGLKQLQEILIEKAPDEYANTILSLDRVLALQNPDNVERTDLILLVGGGHAKRNEREVLIAWEDVPTEYKAARDLQVVEIILHDGEKLIASLYDGLWNEGA
jgi:hypothetical protein